MECRPPGPSVHRVFQARYWSGLPFSTPRDLPFLTQGSNQCLLCLLHWQTDSLPLQPPWKHYQQRQVLKMLNANDRNEFHEYNGIKLIRTIFYESPFSKFQSIMNFSIIIQFQDLNWIKGTHKRTSKSGFNCYDLRYVFTITLIYSALFRSLEIFIMHLKTSNLYLDRIQKLADYTSELKNYEPSFKLVANDIFLKITI